MKGPRNFRPDKSKKITFKITGITSKFLNYFKNQMRK